MDEYNRPNRSPNPEGRFTLFPGKGDPTTFTLTPACKASIDDLAIQASMAIGKTVSRSDIVEAGHKIAESAIVDWIVQEVKRRDAEAAEGGPPAALQGA